jgi:hypothetical protein
LLLKPHYKPSPEGEGWVRRNSNVALLAMASVFQYKRKAYQHEKEVRAIHFKLPNLGCENGLPKNTEPKIGEELPSSGVIVDLDLNDLIDDVVVTPYAEPWFFNVVKGLAEIYGLRQGIVVASDLKQDPVYAKISH